MHLFRFIEGSNSLSKKALTLIEDKRNNIYVSIVLFYEIAIKQKTGKLVLPNSLQKLFSFAISENIINLPITESYLLEYNHIPLYADHRDPFDRLLIATAVIQHVDIITADAQFNNYTNLVNIIW